MPQRSLFDLAHLYTDAWGFVVYRTNTGAPDDVGDATFQTGLAITATSLNLATASPAQQAADNAALATWLSALLNNGWDSGGNPINHPLDQETLNNSSGEALTQDGFTTVVASLYYAYTAPQSSQEVRTLAKELAIKYIDYLTYNNWQLTGNIPAAIAANPSESASSYLPTPGALFTLQNVASEMGIVTGNWNIPALVQDLVTLVDNGLQDQVEQELENTLNQIGIEYQFDAPAHGLPAWMSFTIDNHLPQDFVHYFAEAIISGLEDAIAATVLGPGTVITADANTLVDAAIQQVQSYLPSWVTGSVLTPLLTTVVEQTLPWLDGDEQVSSLYTFFYLL